MFGGAPKSVLQAQNIFDAALATARYLCSGGMNLRNQAQVLTAILRYNNSMAYAQNVLGWAAAYATGVAPLDLPPIVGKARVGARAPVKVLREGKPVVLSVTIAELPEEKEVRARSGGSGGPVTDSRLGLTVQELTREQREELEVKDGGVLVTQVADGPAHRAGVRQGDVLLMLNGVQVKGTGHFRELAGGLPSDRSVPLLVQRRGNPLFLALKLR